MTLDVAVPHPAPAGATAAHLDLRLGGPLALWMLVAMPAWAAMIAGGMTAAMWSERRYGLSVVFAVMTVLAAAGAWRWRSIGYIEDRGSLGQRQRAVGGFRWIDLSDVVAISAERLTLPPIQRLVLWSRHGQTDRRSAAITGFGFCPPPAPGGGRVSGGELYPFRIDWALLGRRNSRRLLTRLRSRGIEIPDELLPRHLRRSLPEAGRDPTSVAPDVGPGRQAVATRSVSRRECL